MKKVHILKRLYNQKINHQIFFKLLYMHFDINCQVAKKKLLKNSSKFKQFFICLIYKVLRLKEVNIA